MQNAKCKVSAPSTAKCKMHNAKCKIRNGRRKYKTQDAKIIRESLPKQVLPKSSLEKAPLKMLPRGSFPGNFCLAIPNKHFLGTYFLRKNPRPHFPGKLLFINHSSFQFYVNVLSLFTFYLYFVTFWPPGDKNITLAKKSR